MGSFTGLLGLIPAHAGKTVSATRLASDQRAHPRSRGENRVSASVDRAPPGSSPLTRGKHRRMGDPHQPMGLIPAHAGKTGSASGWGPWVSAHPRSRGENPFHRCDPHLLTGSSPLTRGKPGRVRDVQPGARLIPAHAGKTIEWLGSMLIPAGSSPLTRGKLPGPRHRRRRRRLIPAHAGKTRADSADDE